MIPVYGIEALCAIHFTTYAVFFKILREGYEAFIIISFMQLLLTYLGGPLTLAKDLAAKGKLTSHMFPLCYIQPWKGPRCVFLQLIGLLHG
jgi:hypothetical protein